MMGMYLQASPPAATQVWLINPAWQPGTANPRRG
jgi:hypothetical protein